MLRLKIGRRGRLSKREKWRIIGLNHPTQISRRLYGHVTGQTAEEIADQARERVGRGLTAIRYRGFHGYDREGLHDYSGASPYASKKPHSL
jgi:hypothetical protein